MKSLKLKKIIALAVVALSITALSPVGASAEWKKDSYGWWNTEGSSYSIGWRLIDGTWYYFDSTGYMKTGWVNDGGTWYYMQSSGAMKTGWVNDNGTWYYLQSSGAMKTGWINDNGTWYFASDSGAMQTGVVQVDGKIYYLAPSGAMAIGTVTINGVSYTFDANGAAVGDKLPTADKAFNGNGSTATVSTPVVPEKPVSNNSSSGGGGSSSISPSRLNTAGNYYGNSTITAAGTFGPASGTSTLDGNVSISNANASSKDTVILQNLKITKTLTIDFGEGNVILDNVEVNGVNISNVGSNSFHARGKSKITNLTVQDILGGYAHIVLEGEATVESSSILSPAMLEVAANASAHFRNITLSPTSPDSPITFTGDLGTTAVVVDRSSSHVVLSPGAVLQSITANAGLAVSGTGTINSVVVAAPGAAINLGVPSIGSVNVNSAAVGALLNLFTATVTNLNISALNADIQGGGTIFVANIGANGIRIAHTPTTVAVLPSVTGLTVADTSDYQIHGNVIIIHSMPTSEVTSSFQSEIQAKYATYALVNIINKHVVGDKVEFEVEFVKKDDSNTDSSIGGKQDYVTHDVLVTNADGTDKDITYDNGVFTAPEDSILYSTVRVYREGGQIGYVTIPYLVK